MDQCKGHKGQAAGGLVRKTLPTWFVVYPGQQSSRAQVLSGCLRNPSLLRMVQIAQWSAWWDGPPLMGVRSGWGGVTQCDTVSVMCDTVAVWCVTCHVWRVTVWVLAPARQSRGTHVPATWVHRDLNTLHKVTINIANTILGGTSVDKCLLWIV